MPRGVFNWTYNDVVQVLKDNGFRLNHIKGSHHFYVSTVKGKLHQVCVPYHGKSVFKPRTLKGMVRQSGLSNSAWEL